MMAMRKRARQYRDVASIRTLQRMAAETKASEAASTAARKRYVLETRSKEREAAEEHWLETCRARPLSLDLSSFAAAQLMASEEGVERAERERQGAETSLTKARLGWQEASLRADRATRDARAARRAEADNHDENVAQDALDRHAFRRRNG